ncbi:MAG: hypothetical protein BGP10_06170 [Rhodanobacter sp. 68-29]|nr:hypothetical protein [Rhodanobacter sp.]ODU74065.1 MAG: hypothetical protein ABT17_09405 [Rhodanobacter sp. SCN 69-32]OJY55422.1 MAG: hypothetical protein BGP10_06170 [Rhodanobacter sp. 68-29]
MSIFDGLYGYEKLMLVCGFVLFLFALAAITVMIVQRRDFKAVIVLFVVAIVLMGFPGIQSIKFSNNLVEIDRLRAQPTEQIDPQQQQQYAQTLAQVEQRATNNPLLQAKVADGYRAIGDLNKGYQLAQAVLQKQPSPQVRATLVPVLTAKLNQVQAATPPTPAPHAAPSGGSVAGSAAPAAVNPDRQRQLATIAAQLQATGVALPAASHAALARAYVTLGQPRQAQINAEQARRIGIGAGSRP